MKTWQCALRVGASRGRVRRACTNVSWRSAVASPTNSPIIPGIFKHQHTSTPVFRIRISHTYHLRTSERVALKSGLRPHARTFDRQAPGRLAPATMSRSHGRGGSRGRGKQAATGGGGGSAWTIRVRGPTAMWRVDGLAPDTAIQKLKQRLEKEHKVPSGEQSLHLDRACKDKPLADSRNLKSLGLRHGSIVYLSFDTSKVTVLESKTEKVVAEDGRLVVSASFHPHLKYPHRKSWNPKCVTSIR